MMPEAADAAVGGFSGPTTPQWEAGWRMEPPVSVPHAVKGASRGHAGRAAARGTPPGMAVSAQGFLVVW